MPRVGNNPNWIRFNLIIKKVISCFNINDLSQPEFIAKCYDWIEPFEEIWEEHSADEEYTSWLIYRGIGNSYSTSAGIDGIEFPHGLLNNQENRRKAAQQIRFNFAHELSEGQMTYINSSLIQYLSSDKKDGFIFSYSHKASKINPISFDTYLRSYFIPALELIEKPLEKFAAILIYAQSGCIPLDIYDQEIERCRTHMNDLQMRIDHYSKLKEQHTFDIYHSRDYHELDDPHFFGTFYGYFRQYLNGDGKTSYKGLIPFELEIHLEDTSGVVAEFSFTRYTPSMKEVPIRLTGKPMIGNQTIHIVLQGERGDDFITMSYKWIDIKNNALQFRQGVLMTLDRAERCPQVQNFIFFNRPVSKNDEKYVDAFLRLSGDRFIVPDDSISALLGGTEDFLEKYGKKFSGYTVSMGQAILNAQDDNMSDHEIVQALLELKQNSMSPFVITAKEEKQTSDFFRSLLSSEKEMDLGLLQE